jgi:hypothetical protein
MSKNNEIATTTLTQLPSLSSAALDSVQGGSLHTPIAKRPNGSIFPDLSPLLPPLPAPASRRPPRFPFQPPPFV